MAAYTTIDNPELYFQCKIWSGNATDDTSITLDGSENMQPDFVWTKRRNASTNHDLWDAVRGALEQIASNNTEAEATISSSLKSFNSDGFTVGTNTNLNASGGTYVAWCWKESATAGFDIVAYTGSGSAHTISHSLSAVPSVVILKGRSFGDGWGQYHKTSGNPAILAFDGDVADRYSSKWGPFFNSTAPTSSVFSVGTDTAINTSSGTHIAYLFAEKQGFSKFGSYKGNGNADGPFVFTGMRPAYVVVRRTDSAENWFVFDNKRDTFNPEDTFIRPNLTNADADESGGALDFLSNGFKIRNSGDSFNNSSGTYVFMAFAEQPFVNSNGVPGNAR